MPVIRTTDHQLDETTRPAWSDVTAAGMFEIPAVGGTFDRHYHDCDEYWLIYDGSARVMSEGEEYLIGAGDIVCTKAGDEHDILEVHRDLKGFYFEGALVPGGEPGHLHRSPDLAAGHPVATGELDDPEMGRG